MAAAARRRQPQPLEDDEEMNFGDDEEGQDRSSSAVVPNQPAAVVVEKKNGPRFFKESLKTLEELALQLACVKCGKLAQQRIYMLGNCTHKYCEKCVTSSAGRPCVTCKAVALSKDAKPDRFSTSILNDIPAVYYAIARMEKMGVDNKVEEEEERSSPKAKEAAGNTEKREMDDTSGINSGDLKSIPHPFSPPKDNSLKMPAGEDENFPDLKDDFFENDDEDDGGKNKEVFAAEFDEEIFENTPVSRIRPTSPDPDIMEETPQHKLNMSMISSSMKRLSSKISSAKKVLHMESPKKKSEKAASSKPSVKSVATTEEGTISITPLSKLSEKGSKEVIDIDETLFSEEELFKSQQNDGGKGGKELPVLTPHFPGQVGAAKAKKNEKVEKSTSKPAEEDDKKKEKGGSSDVNVKEVKKPTRGRQKKSSTNDSNLSSSLFEEQEQHPPTLTQYSKEEETKRLNSEKQATAKKEQSKPKTLPKPDKEKVDLKQRRSSSNDSDNSKDLFEEQHLPAPTPPSKAGAKNLKTGKPAAAKKEPSKPKTSSKLDTEKEKADLKLSERKGKETKTKTTTDDDKNAILEHLFRSPSTDGGDRVSRRSQVLPILSPHTPGQDTNSKNEKPASGRKRKPSEEYTASSDVFESSRSKTSEASNPPEKPQRKFFKSRDSRTAGATTPEPPTLTQHPKVEAKEDDFKAKPKRVSTTKAKASSTPATASDQSKSKTKPKPAVETPTTPAADKGRSKSRAVKSKLNVSISSSTATEDDPKLKNEYEFDSKEAESNRKRRKISTASNLNASSISLDDSIGGGVKEKRNAKGETGLHIACREGQFDKVKNLVQGGADVNAVDNAEWTPLHEAIGGKGGINEKANIVRFLCKHNCNVNAIGGPEDDTPLHAAALCGLENVVEILLEYGASPNIRNIEGRLPVDNAFNDVIIKMLKEKACLGGSASTSTESNNTAASTSTYSSNYNSALTTVTQEDPAVIQVMLKKAVVFFNYEIDPDTFAIVKSKLKLKLSEKLTSNVTHIVHHVREKDRALIRVPFSSEYVFGLAHGMWQVGHDWIEKSLQDSKCLSPSAFEVSGNIEDVNGATHRYPGKSRMNKEKGNPGLLDGFCFYLYKTCSYESNGSQEDASLKLSKRELVALIQGAGGKITNREPDPETVDPLEAPTRFHANQLSCSQSPFMITSHVILYDEKSVPPKGKMYRMEHVKTMKSDWVVQSIAQFSLLDPEEFY